MAESITPRFGIETQSEGSDRWPARPGWEQFKATLEQLGAIFDQGPAVELPPAGIPGRFLAERDTGAIKYDTGGAWLTLNPVGGGGAGGALSFGLAGAEGTGIRAARANHTHAMPINPLPAHVSAADPHPLYALETDARFTNARTPANDADLVHKTGDETINGRKSFPSPYGVQAAGMRPRAVAGGSEQINASTHWQDAAGPSLTFTAPLSGCVMLYLDAYLRSEADGYYATAGLQVLSLGSGDTALAAGVMVVNTNVRWVKAGGHKLLTGLIPGMGYDARACFVSNNAAVAARISYHNIAVVPCF